MEGQQPQIGEVVQGYRLQALLAVGGMGNVFRAVHTTQGHPAAVKVLSSRLHGDRDVVLRFLQEARIVNDIHHPNIVNIYDFVRTEDPPRVAFVMELLEGPPLDQVLRKTTLSVEQALNATLQLADALGAVHRAGVVHRDLKPHNVMVVQPLDSPLDGVPSVKLLDFGIAKSELPGHGPKTMAGSVMGTPTYMAPEQVTSEPISPATDLYALAEILFEMLTGRPLWSGDSLQILRQKVTDQVPDASLGSTACADELQHLIQACVAPAPENRPALESFSRTVAALKDQVRSGATVDAPPSAEGFSTAMFYRQIVSDLDEAMQPETEAENRPEPVAPLTLMKVADPSTDVPEAARPQKPSARPNFTARPAVASPVVASRDVPRRGLGPVGVGGLAVTALVGAALAVGTWAARQTPRPHPLDWQLEEWRASVDPYDTVSEDLPIRAAQAQRRDTWEGYAEADGALRAALVADPNDAQALAAYVENTVLWKWASLDDRQRRTLHDVLRHARSSGTESLQLLRAQARLALAVEDRARARSLLAQALALSPADVRTRVALAEAAASPDPLRFQQDRAIDDALDGRPRAVRVQAELWGRSGDFDRALKVLQPRLRDQPTNGLLWIDQARLQMLAGDMEQADGSLRKAERTQGVGPLAVLLRARLARQRGDVEQQRDLLEGLLRQSRLPAGIRMEVGSALAAIHLAAGRPDLALEVATEDNVEFAEARLQLGRPGGLQAHASPAVAAGAALLRGDVEQAKSRIEQAMDSSPHSARLAAYAAALDLLRGDAEVDLSHLLTCDPRDPSAPPYPTALDKELEERVFLAIRDQDPPPGPAWALLGVLRFQAGRLASATEALAKHEGPVSALYSGHVALAHDDGERALSWAERLQAAQPRAFATYLLQGRALAATGRSAAAVRAYDQALRLRSSHGLQLERAEALSVHAPEPAAAAARAVLAEHPNELRAARLVRVR